MDNVYWSTRFKKTLVHINVYLTSEQIKSTQNNN